MSEVNFEDTVPQFDDPFLRFNLHLEECIDAFYEDSGDKSRLLAVFQALKVCMTQDGHVLVSVEAPDNAAKFFDPSKIKPGDEIVADEDLHFTLIRWGYADGTVFMPVFTSREKMQKGGPEGCSTLSIFLDQYMEQVLENPNVDGILINPGEHSFLLHKDTLKMLVDWAKQ